MSPGLGYLQFKVPSSIWSHCWLQSRRGGHVAGRYSFRLGSLRHLGSPRWGPSGLKSQTVMNHQLSHSYVTSYSFLISSSHVVIAHFSSLRCGAFRLGVSCFGVSPLGSFWFEITNGHEPSAFPFLCYFMFTSYSNSFVVRIHISFIFACWSYSFYVLHRGCILIIMSRRLLHFALLVIDG